MGDETEKNTKRYSGTMKYLDKLGIGYITPNFDVFVTPSSFSSTTTTIEEGDPVEFTLKFNETTPQLEAINVVPLKVQSFKGKKHGYSLKTSSSSSRIRCFQCGVVGHFARECKRKGKNGGCLVGSTSNSKKGSFVSVKKKGDVRKVEMVEDCFVLEFDPFNKSNDDDDDDDDGDDDDDDDGESQKYGNSSKTWPSRSSIRCYECGVMGHFARECKRKGKSGGRLVGSTCKKGSLVSVKKEDDVRKVEKVEDCFVLEFNPFTKSNHDGDDDDDGDGDGDDCGAIVCVKNVEDVKKYEQVEDCFILEFDPNEPVMFSNLSLSGGDSEDVAIIGEKGKVACKDYPHPRNLCGTHPFQTTRHEVHCKMCYCFVCEEPAPCESWTTAFIGKSLSHCDAVDAPEWRKLKRWKEHGN